MGREDQHVEQVFAEAIRIADDAARRAYIDRACAGNKAFRQDVESLVESHLAAGSFLGRAVTLPPSDMGMECAGVKIGRYKLLEQIGEGGFGVVWMADQEEPVRRRVALKIIKLGMDTKEVVARFEAERQALAMMEHPNIASVFDGGSTEAGRPYFVMELVNGLPITEFCDRQQLPTVERLRLFMKVCHAVQHAHQKGIIHRDIKPTNVLVTLHDGEPVPKVIDFGIAKALGQKLTDKTLFTGFQKMLGTPAYMSPEQAELSGLDIDTRADIYSLGVLLYELLTGVTPFDAETLRKAALDEIRRLIREAEPPKPSTRLQTMGERLTEVAKQRQIEPRNLHRLVRGDLDWIVMTCLDKDRRRRYGEAASLADDLERYLKSEPVMARPPTATYRVGKFLGRHRRELTVAGATALILSLLSIGVFWWSGRQVMTRTAASVRSAERIQTNSTVSNAHSPQAEITATPDANAQIQPLMDLLAKSDRGQVSATAQTVGKILAGEAQSSLQQSASNWIFANARSLEATQRRQAMFCLSLVVFAVGEGFRIPAHNLALDLAADPDLETRLAALKSLEESMKLGPLPEALTTRNATVLLGALKESDSRVRSAAITGLAMTVNHGLRGPLLDQVAPELLKNLSKAEWSARFYLENSLGTLVSSVKDPDIPQQAVRDLKACVAAAKSERDRADWLQSLAELQLALGQTDEAIDAFKQAVKVSGRENPNLSTRLEAALWAAGRGDEALASPAIRVSSYDVQNRMKALAQTNDVARLLKVAERALDGYLPMYAGYPARNSRSEPDAVISEATRLLISLQKLDELDEFLKGAMKRLPGSPDAVLGRIKLAEARNHKEEAVALCEKELAEHPWNTEVLTEMEQLSSQLQRMAYFETALRTVVEKSPSEGGPSLKLVSHYVSSGRTNEAQKVITAFRATLSDRTASDGGSRNQYEMRQWHSVLAQMLEKCGDFGDAAAALRQSAESTSDLSSYDRHELARLYRKAGNTNELAELESSDPAIRQESLQEQVRAQVRAGKTDDALATARQILVLDLKSNEQANAWSLLTSTFNGSDQARLIPLFEEVLSKDTNSVVALRYLAMLSASDPSKAVAFAERAYRLAPDDASVLYPLVNAFYRAGRFSRLFELAAESLQKNRDIDLILSRPYPAFPDTNIVQNLAALVQQRLVNATGWQRLPLLRSQARLESMMGNHGVAISVISQVIAEPNQWYSADRDFLISEYRAVGKLDEALEACRQAAATHPPSMSNYRNDGWLQAEFAALYQLKGMTDDAADAYRAMRSTELERIKSGQADAGTYNSVAWAYLEGRVLPAEALQLARKALALAPDDANIGDTLAWALMRNGEFAEALARLAPALTNRAAAEVPRKSAWKALFEMAKTGVPESLWTNSMNAFEEALRKEPVELARLNLVRAHFCEHHREAEKAASFRLASGYPPESAWAILGPFASEQGRGYAQAFIPEEQSPVDHNIAHPTSQGRLGWVCRADGADDDVIDLQSMFQGLDWAVAYLTLTIESDRAQKVELRLGSDDQAILWLNAKRVFEQRGVRQLTPDDNVVPVELRQGENHLLVKVCDEREAWAFTLRLTSLGGARLSGVRFLTPISSDEY